MPKEPVTVVSQTQTFTIHPEGRYVVVVTMASGSNPVQAELDIDKVSAGLTSWWDSGDKFCVMALSKHYTLEFRRADKPEA